MLNWFKSTFTYWVELYKDIRIWWIFRRTAREYTDQLNKDFQLRVDWLGRVYGVVNLPEEVQTASGEIQQAYVLNKISTYGNFMMQIGLADIVYPQIQKITPTAYLIVLWPVFEELAVLPVLGNILKSAFVGFLALIIYKFIYTNTELWVGIWNKFTHFVLN